MVATPLSDPVLARTESRAGLLLRRLETVPSRPKNGHGRHGFVTPIRMRVQGMGDLAELAGR